jgi:uncharacterized protein DUF4287
MRLKCPRCSPRDRCTFSSLVTAKNKPAVRIDGMPGTFKAYAENIRTRSGKSLEDYWTLANKKGFIKSGRVVAKHSEMLAWLKSKGIGLGHVHANMVILYFRLRVDDPQLTPGMKKWAYETGYRGLAGRKK